MIKILGTKSAYNDQTNDASVELFKDYFKKSKMIACGPNTAACGFEIAGWPMNIFTPGEQVADSILMVMENPKNLSLFKARRDINYDEFPVNEVPQAYEVLAQILYKTNVCKYVEGLDFSIIKQKICAGIPLMVSGQFPAGGHYVLIVGFDDVREIIYFNDSYPIQWPDGNGYNREMNLDFLKNNISKHRVEFQLYKSVI